MWKYKFDEMMGMSYYFYEIQRSGRLPANTRVPWRGDTLKKTGGGSLDGEHEGGYFDAGDQCIFMLPQTYAISRLCETVVLYKDTLEKTFFDGSSNYVWAREACKWGADFLVRAIKNETSYLLHIGNIGLDHGYLGRGEIYPQSNRNILYCSTGQCADITGQAAAALAHASRAFADNSALSARYWSAAITVYAMTRARQLVSSAGLGNSNRVFSSLYTYYPSTGVASHVFYGAASMWQACRARNCTDAALYLQDALKIGPWKEADGGQKWYWQVSGWDNSWWDAALILAENGIAGSTFSTGQAAAFIEFPTQFAKIWVDGSAPTRVSPFGQRWVLPWGSNRFSASGAAILMRWANLPSNMMKVGGPTPQQARCTAIKQLHYVAGDNDRGSYIAGFGENDPQRSHHRNANCSPKEQLEDRSNHCEKYFLDSSNPNNQCNGVIRPNAQGVCYPTANRKNKYTVHGALAGGPKTASDAGNQARVPYSLAGWNDWRTDWVSNEVTIDYNAGYTMALAAAMSLPASFWTGPCTGSSDIKLTTPVGLSRDTGPPPRDPVPFESFAPFGWTRTLPPFMSVIP